MTMGEAMAVPIMDRASHVGLVALFLAATTGDVKPAPSGSTAADAVTVTISCTAPLRACFPARMLRTARLGAHEPGKSLSGF